MKIVNNPIVTCDNVTWAYPGSAPVLRDISLDLAPGEFLALIGPNGAGKTTFLKGILGQLSTTGSLVVPPHHSIGYVPQNTSVDQDFPISALGVIRLGILMTKPWWKRLTRADKERAQQALMQVGLETQYATQFGALSGGQQQRVLLARALAINPSLVLLDEPFNGLDQPNRDALVGTINHLKEQGIGVIASTHDLGLVHGIADKVAIINHGLIAWGPPQEVMVARYLDQAYGSGFYA